MRCGDILFLSLLFCWLAGWFGDAVADIHMYRSRQRTLYSSFRCLGLRYRSSNCSSDIHRYGRKRETTNENILDICGKLLIRTHTHTRIHAYI